MEARTAQIPKLIVRYDSRHPLYRVTAGQRHAPDSACTPCDRAEQNVPLTAITVANRRERTD